MLKAPLLLPCCSKPCNGPCMLRAHVLLPSLLKAHALCLSVLKVNVLRPYVLKANAFVFPPKSCRSRKTAIYACARQVYAPTNMHCFPTPHVEYDQRVDPARLTTIWTCGSGPARLGLCAYLTRSTGCVATGIHTLPPPLPQWYRHAC